MCPNSVKTALWQMESALTVLPDLTWSLTASVMEPVRVSDLGFCYKVNRYSRTNTSILNI